MDTIRGIFKLMLFAMLVILVVPTQGLILLITRGPFSYHLPTLWHAGVAKALGIRFTVTGTPNTGHQTLYMSNHLSYLDIPIIGGMIKASFVAKSEVEGWALFGFLATLQQTAFIQRKRSEIKKQKNSLQARIEDGQSLIIFPEGTSTDGREVLPFKSSLFSLVLFEGNDDLYIQPVSVSLLTTDKITPKTQDDLDLYAWHRDMDMELGSHLWRFAKARGATLNLNFHKPLRAKDYTDRKILAKTCHERVSMGLQNNKLAA